MAQYRIPVEETFSWQRPVKDILNDPPGVPAKGDRYIVGVGTGAWSGKDNDIAWYDGADWKFDTPTEGWQCWVEDVNEYYSYNGAAWVLSDLSAKADKVVGATAGDFASLDSDGNLEDSGKNPTDFEDAGAVAAHEGLYDHTELHVQGTDQGLDTGGPSAVTAAQAKEAYDRRGSYDAELGCILMTIV
jgi:hypothetical protein